MASTERPLDQVVWRSPELAMQFGGIHENTVLFYFAKSPFFDPTSTNATVETQAMYNPEMLSILETRESFETHLEKLNGLEYRVHLGPKDFGPEAPIGEGVWVIRKQNRRIVYGAGNGAAVDAQVTVLATYFVIGEVIYAARSVHDIIASRLLSTTHALSKVSQLASSLTTFTPALGHYYMPPHLKPKKAVSSSQTVPNSRDATPALDTPITDKGTGATDHAILIDAYRQFNMFGNEYMDENPLLGEPGSFVFSASKEYLQSQKDSAAKRAQQEADLKKAQEEARLLARAQSVAPATPKVKKEVVPSKRAMGKDGRPRVKKRKTKAIGVSTPGTPMVETPGPATPVATPG